MNKDNKINYSLWVAGLAVTASLTTAGYYYWLKTRNSSS